MIDESKEKNSSVEGIQSVKEKSFSKSEPGFRTLFLNAHSLIPIGSGVLQVIVGLTLVSASLLGLISAVWLSAVLSLLGSISCMSGVFLVYHVFSTQGTFESLINQSIRRVISAQN
ncbi:MAG: hypothetical protein WEA56_14070 [Balneolaceae bacterium]